MGSVVARSDATIPGAMLDTLQELLGTLVATRSAALEANAGDEDAPAKHDGGLQAAFDSSVIRTLNRIDTLVDTPRLWKPDRSTARTLTLNDLTHRLRRADANMDAARPSSRYADRLELSVQQGHAVVVMQVPGGVVAGVGETFGEAMRDFDTKFATGKPLAPAAPEKKAEVAA